jgi:hypothetical protein
MRHPELNGNWIRFERVVKLCSTLHVDEEIPNQILTCADTDLAVSRLDSEGATRLVSPLEERECLQPSGTCRPSADPQAVQPEHLRRLLADPTDRPGTPVETSEGPPVWKMPVLELSPSEIEALVAFINDDGQSWHHRGVPRCRPIGQIRVDPR